MRWKSVGNPFAVARSRADGSALTEHRLWRASSGISRREGQSSLSRARTESRRSSFLPSTMEARRASASSDGRALPRWASSSSSLPIGGLGPTDRSGTNRCLGCSRNVIVSFRDGENQMARDALARFGLTLATRMSSAVLSSATERYPSLARDNSAPRPRCMPRNGSLAVRR